MRKKLVAGNWKMNNNLSEGIALAKEIKELSSSVDFSKCGMVLCTPFIHLTSVHSVIAGSPIKLGAQNCSSESKGAYTGEISAAMLASCGVEYVIIGHSERRSYYKEDNEFLRKKVVQALANNLTPIYCCGETLEERNTGKLFDVVRSQIEEGIFGLKEEEFAKVVIAYEPVWAIGTGVTATKEQAQEMHEYIRRLISEKMGAAVAESTTILYGGSCNAKNAAELFACPDVDGGLIGGASLIAADFIKIANSF